MQIYRAKDYEDMSKKAANIIASQVVLKPDCVLGLATGSTPIGAYKNLVEKYEQGDLDFSQVTTVNLDEYKGLPRENDQSYYYFMHVNLFDHVNVKPENTHLPDGTKEDANEECARYEELIRSLGGQDLQLLGLGHNGHIGFNEPGTPFTEETHIVELTEKTRSDNARFFDNDINQVPTHAITMGIATIMKAKKILLVASGANKADAVAAMVNGPVDPACPASVLQNHADVVVVVDEAAAAKLAK